MREYVYEGSLATIKLYNVEVPGNAIPDDAFCEGSYVDRDSTNGLRRILLSGNIELIGKNAFNGCEFAYITLPESITELGSQSCYNWDKIQWIYSKSETPPSSEGAFGGTTPKTTRIYVPVGSAEAYRTAPGWDYFTTFIETDEAPSAGIDETETASKSSVRWVGGKLIIESDNVPAPYCVYKVDGTLVASGYVTLSKVELLHPQDFYVVKVGNSVFKVF